MAGIPVFSDFKIRQAGLPFAALGAEAFDVGLAKVFLGPVGGADDVVGEETRVICRRERLVGDERERVISRGPLAAALLVAQAMNGSRAGIKRDHVVGGLDVLPGGVRR